MLLTIVLTFFGAAACYRLGIAHERHGRPSICCRRAARRVDDFLVEILMAIMAVFMIVYGIKLCEATWHNSIAEFPVLSVGIVYSPIPIGGVFTLLFIIEHLTIGRPADDAKRDPQSRRFE